MTREELPHIPSESIEPHVQFIMTEMLGEIACKASTIQDMEVHIRCMMRLCANAGAVHADMATSRHWANLSLKIKNSTEEELAEFVQTIVKSHEKHRGIDLSDIWGDEHWSKKDNNISKDNMEEYPKDIQILEDKLGPQFFLCPERGYAEGKCDSEPTEEEIAKYIDFVYECESLEFYIEEKEGSWEWSCSIEGYEED